MKLVIDREVAVSLMNYLSTKPYAEVYKLIQALSELAPLPTRVEECQTGPSVDSPL